MRISSMIFGNGRGESSTDHAAKETEASAGCNFAWGQLLGLKTLAEHRPANHFSSRVTRKLQPSSPPPLSGGEQKEGEMMIGHEVNEEDDDGNIGSGWGSCWRRHSGRQFPPPIPMYYMPIILDRSYEDGGRLVIRQVKSQHAPHKLFRADRKNGRVSLTVIHMHRLDQEGDESDAAAMGEEDDDENEDAIDKFSFSDIHLQSLPISISSPSLLLSPPSAIASTKSQEYEDWEYWKNEKATEADVVRQPFALKYSMETLSSSMPESSTTARSGCFSNDGRQTSSFFHPPPPLLHLVQS